MHAAAAASGLSRLAAHALHMAREDRRSRPTAEDRRHVAEERRLERNRFVVRCNGRRFYLTVGRDDVLHWTSDPDRAIRFSSAAAALAWSAERVSGDLTAEAI